MTRDGERTLSDVLDDDGRLVPFIAGTYRIPIKEARAIVSTLREQQAEIAKLLRAAKRLHRADGGGPYLRPHLDDFYTAVGLSRKGL